MAEVSIIPYSENHRGEFIQLSIDYMTEISNQLLENYNFNLMPLFEPSLRQWVRERVDQYIGLKPPEGRLYIIEVGEEVAGMGAIHKIGQNVGEIKRMYNRPEYRGKGLGKRLFYKLMKDGERFGCKSYRLDTPKWAYAAQHIYRSAGFSECEPYPESEIPEVIQPYWIWMEKKE